MLLIKVRFCWSHSKRNTIQMDGVSFCFLLISNKCYRITTICSPTERAKSVGEEPKRRRWRMKRGDEVAAVGISAARRGNPGHRKSRLHIRLIPTAQAEFYLTQCRWFEQGRGSQRKADYHSVVCFFFRFSFGSNNSTAHSRMPRLFTGDRAAAACGR